MQHSVHSYFCSIHSHSLPQIKSKLDDTNTERIKYRLYMTCIMHCKRHNGNIMLWIKSCTLVYLQDAHVCIIETPLSLTDRPWKVYI